MYVPRAVARPRLASGVHRGTDAPLPTPVSRSASIAAVCAHNGPAAGDHEQVIPCIGCLDAASTLQTVVAVAQVGSAAAAAPTGAELTRAFSTAPNWQRLAELVREAGDKGGPRDNRPSPVLAGGLSALNGRHIACLLSKLARLPAPPGNGSNAAAQQHLALAHGACSAAVALRHTLRPRELSTVLWAASKLPRPPPHEQLRCLLHELATPRSLRTAQAQDVSLGLYAAAVLGLQVDEEQLQPLLSAAAAALPAAAPQAVSLSLWAVASLQYRPGAEWLSAAEGRATELLQLQQQRRAVGGSSDGSSSFAPQGLHQLLWAMARLRWVPGSAFMDAFWRASGQSLRYMTPHGTSGLLWAAATLGTPPPDAWSHTCLERLREQLDAGSTGSQDVVNALWAIARMRGTGAAPTDSPLAPGAAWLSSALCAARRTMPSASPQELALLLWACGRLEVRPDQAWMQDWLVAMQHCFGR